MSHLEWRCTILADAAGDDFAVLDHGINVKNLALDEFFENELRRMIAPVITRIEIGQNFPNSFAALAFADAESGYLVTRLDDPRTRHAVEIVIDLIRVENAGVFWLISSELKTPVYSGHGMAAEDAMFRIASLSRKVWA